MTRLVVDAELRQKLLGLREPLELVDEKGESLGRVFPNAEQSEYEFFEPPIDEEELRRRENSDKWHTTAEVLVHLKSLERAEET